MGTPFVLATLLERIETAIFNVEALGSRYAASSDFVRGNANLRYPLALLDANLRQLRDELRAQSINDNADNNRLIGPSSQMLMEDLLDLDEQTAQILASANEPWSGELVGHRVQYAFRQSTVVKLRESCLEITKLVENLRDVLLVVCDQQRQDLISTESLGDARQTVRQYLNAPDPTTDHLRFLRTRHSSTGLWLLESSYFKTWLESDNSLIWLNGFAGSGKSVLCSAAIDHVSRTASESTSTGLAYFYFNFADGDKLDTGAMLRSLIVQLTSRTLDGGSLLTAWLQTSQKILSGVRLWQKCLQFIIQMYEHVYIFVDAVDEVSRTEQHAVLESLADLRMQLVSSLHVFVSSRDTPDIREFFSRSSGVREIQVYDQASADIQRYVKNTLSSNSNLQRWTRFHEEIEANLVQKSQGMFRYAQLQLASLKLIPASRRHLKQFLGSMPRTLDETYERILSNIEDGFVNDARRVLMFLCFSARPVTTKEVIDFLAINYGEAGRFDPDERLEDEQDLSLLAPLVHIDLKSTIIRLAHFSLQEYLLSTRIAGTSAERFGLSEAPSHQEIAAACLIYILEPTLCDECSDDRIYIKFPMARYAFAFWHHHVSGLRDLAPTVEALLSRLFELPKTEAFCSWIRMCDPDLYHGEDQTPHFDRDTHEIASPTYYAALLGLTSVFEHWNVANQVLAGSSVRGDDMGKCVYGTPLQAAAYEGHADVIRQLLSAGVDVNASGGKYDRALQAASCRGHANVVSILLGTGADPNIISGPYGTALHAAVCNDREDVVRLLIEAGAVVDCRARNDCVLVQKEIKGRNEGLETRTTFFVGTTDLVAKSVLEVPPVRYATPAPYSVEEVPLDTALLLATSLGYRGVVKLLLDAGADARQCDSKYGRSPLIWGVLSGSLDVVHDLISQGLNLDHLDYQGGSALHIAMECDFDAAANALVAAGADLGLENDLGANVLETTLLASRRVDPTLYSICPERTDMLSAGANSFRVDVLVCDGAPQEGYEYIVRKTFELKKKTRKRLYDEKHILNFLRHPNIVSLLAYSEDRANKTRHRGQLYLEYCSGGDLTLYLPPESDDGESISQSSASDQAERQDSSLPDTHTSPTESTQFALDETTAWSFWMDLASALAYCHHGLAKEKGRFLLKYRWRQVLHRDIKPANVVIEERPRKHVKLCDLGISRVKDDAGAQTIGIGTKDYSPPEVKYESKEWTQKGDVFSFGETLLQLQTNFENSTYQDVLGECTHNDPEKRPSSLILLETAAKELVRLTNLTNIRDIFLLSENPDSNYLQQCYDRVLEHFCSSYERGSSHRDNFVNRLNHLIEDARTGEIRSREPYEEVLVQLLLGNLQAARSACSKLYADEDTVAFKIPWNNRGLTPLHIAAFDGIESVTAEYLTHLGCSQACRTRCGHVQDIGGRTALHMAAKGGHQKIVEMLLAATPGIAKIVTVGKRSALHEAAAFGHVGCFRLMREAEESMYEMPDEQGVTPAQEAVRSGIVLDGHYTSQLGNLRLQ